MSSGTDKKSKLHPRNKNRNLYNLESLIQCKPSLANYIKPNKAGNPSIDFSNPEAVKILNKALLHHYYGVEYWEFPDANLCPPIPGRVDYLHYIADLLRVNNSGEISKNNITCLDIGMGASCIYPILGVTEYDWNFIGSDIAEKSIANAKNIIASNPQLKGKIECRLQNNPTQIFKGIIATNEKIDVTISNPPFHASKEDALKGTRRKIKNLSGKKEKNPDLNFAGISNELIYKGGEFAFIGNMIKESMMFQNNCLWFTTLVSKESNLKGIYKLLDKAKVAEFKTIKMGTGNKISRIVAWTFLSTEAQNQWRVSRK